MQGEQELLLRKNPDTQALQVITPVPLTALHVEVEQLAGAVQPKQLETSVVVFPGHVLRVIDPREQF